MTFSTWIDQWSKEEAERTVVYSQVLLETDPHYYGKTLFGLISLIVSVLIVSGLCAIFFLSSDPLKPAVAGLIAGSLVWFWPSARGAFKADKLARERIRQRREKEAIRFLSNDHGGQSP